MATSRENITAAERKLTQFKNDQAKVLKKLQGIPTAAEALGESIQRREEQLAKTKRAIQQEIQDNNQQIDELAQESEKPENFFNFSDVIPAAQLGYDNFKLEQEQEVYDHLIREGRALQAEMLALQKKTAKKITELELKMENMLTEIKHIESQIDDKNNPDPKLLEQQQKLLAKMDNYQAQLRQLNSRAFSSITLLDESRKKIFEKDLKDINQDDLAAVKHQANQVSSTNWGKLAGSIALRIMAVSAVGVICLYGAPIVLGALGLTSLAGALTGGFSLTSVLKTALSFFSLNSSTAVTATTAATLGASAVAGYQLNQSAKKEWDEARPTANATNTSSKLNGYARRAQSYAEKREQKTNLEPTENVENASPRGQLIQSGNEVRASEEFEMITQPNQKNSGPSFSQS